MLTFLHIVYSKNRTEAWGFYAAKKKQEPPFCSPLLEFQKEIPPINMSRLKS